MLPTKPQLYRFHPWPYYSQRIPHVDMVRAYTPLQISSMLSTMLDQTNHGFENLDERVLHRWEPKGGWLEPAGGTLFATPYRKSSVPKDYREADIIHRAITERHDMKWANYRIQLHIQRPTAFALDALFANWSVCRCLQSMVVPLFKRYDALFNFPFPQPLNPYRRWATLFSKLF